MKENLIYNSLNKLKEYEQKYYSTYQIAVWLKNNKNLYHEVILYTNEPCEPCKEWEKLGLPYDCLQKPEYCKRKSIYYDFINAYEETNAKITKIQN